MTEKIDSSEIYKKTEMAHSAYYQPLLENHSFIVSGPELDENGSVLGGIYILRMPSRKGVKAFMVNDP